MCSSERRKCRSYGAPDVEDTTIATQMSFLGPSRISPQLVYRIECSPPNSTLCQAKSHRSIVSPHRLRGEMDLRQPQSRANGIANC